MRKLGIPPTNHNYKRVQKMAAESGVTLQLSPGALASRGYVPPRTPAPPPATVRKGTLTEAAILNALIGAGYNVLVPFGVARYDLVIETADGFKRVQCKTGHLTVNGRMTFNLSSRSLEGVSRVYDGEVDYFGVFLPAAGSTYLIPMGEVAGCRNTAYFRLADDDAVDERSTAHYAAPYRLVAQQERALAS
jgi:hypothetical protein